MREGRLVLPALYPFVTTAINRVVDAFGGATVTYGDGYWKPNGCSVVLDPVRIVDVAYQPSDENDAKLFDIAAEFLIAAEQKSVYVRYASGHVQFVEHTSVLENGKGAFAPSLTGVLEAINILTDKSQGSERRVDALQFLEDSMADHAQ